MFADAVLACSCATRQCSIRVRRPVPGNGKVARSPAANMRSKPDTLMKASTDRLWSSLRGTFFRKAVAGSIRRPGKIGGYATLASPLSSISEYLRNRHMNQDSRVGILLSPRFFPEEDLESRRTTGKLVVEIN